MTRLRVSGVLLAAGLSSRFGDDPPKQLVRTGGVPQVRRIATEALASSLDELIVVVGHRADEVQSLVDDLDLRKIENGNYTDGQSTSVRAGLAAVSESMDAVLFLTCDQPYLDRQTIDQILDAYRQAPTKILVPTHKGQRGSPVLFSRALFAELAGLEGDRGGRQLFAEHPGEIQSVELLSGQPLADFDTPAELAALLLQGD